MESKSNLNLRAKFLIIYWFTVTKLFVNESLSVQSSFKSTITRVLNAQIESIRFSDPIQAAKTINTFVANSTHNMITEVIDPNGLSSHVNMIIANCIYFKGIWKNTFSKNRTFKDQFFIDNKNTVRVEYMTVKATFKYRYFSDLGEFTAVSLPYDNSGMTMLLILPKNKTGLSNLISKMSNFDWTKIEDSMYETSVNVTIPKFNVTFDSNIEQNLKKVSRHEKVRMKFRFW